MHRFTVSDDMARVRVDGKLVIDSWSPHEPKADGARVPLTAGRRHSLRAEHAERTGEAHMKLLRSSPGQEQEAVPESQPYAE